MLDGADAIMLSGETSVGAWPLEAVTTMARIIESTEEHGFDKISPLSASITTATGAVTKAAVEIGDVVDAKFLITFTETGGSARRMARLRPKRPMLAFTSQQRAVHSSPWSGASRPTSCPGCHTPTSSRCRWTST